MIKKAGIFRAHIFTQLLKKLVFKANALTEYKSSKVFSDMSHGTSKCGGKQKLFCGKMPKEVQKFFNFCFVGTVTSLL